MVSAAASGGTVVLNVYGLHFFGEAWNDPISRLQKYMVSVMKFLDGILLKHKVFIESRNIFQIFHWLSIWIGSTR